MKIISVANQKGGVGKTTTAIELGYCLAELKQKVLLIDFDQQANLTNYLDINNEKNISMVMDGEILPEEAVFHKDGIDVIPASGELSKADKKYTDADDIFILEDICKMIDDQFSYDIILIDNSPSRNTLLSMAYVASDYIIAPTECDDGAVNGILAIEADIAKLRDGRHKLSHAEIIAILLNKFEKTTMHLTALDVIKTISETKIQGMPPVFTIRKSIKASESKTFRKPIQKYKRHNNAAIDYRKAAEGILKRIGGE